MEISSAENCIPLRCEGFCAESFAAKDQVESHLHGFRRVRQVPPDEGQEAIMVTPQLSQEEQPLLIRADGEDLAYHAIVDGRGLAHWRHRFGNPP
jgi:hypothetical protein